MDEGIYKAAILDMDGVITRTADLHARAWKRMFDEYLQRRAERDGESHEPFDREGDYHRYVDGKPRDDGTRSWLNARGMSIPEGDRDDPPGKETIRGLGNRKNQLFHELLDAGGVEVWDDTIQQIGHWKRAGWKVGVFSSSRNCEAVLRAANVLDLFDAKVDGNDLERLQLAGKPAPDMLLRVAQQLGVEASQTIVVEDARAGIQAGRAGRFGLVVGVARNREASALRQAGADCVVHDLRELETVTRCPPGQECLRTPTSAIEHLEWIAQRVRQRDLALFLDYDGTLTPIVPRPEDATLAEEMRGLLRDLARRCTVAIVSGRDRQNVEQMVGVENLVYAGSHGFDIGGPGIEMQHEGAKEALPEIEQAEQVLRQQLAAIEGVRVERKLLAIAVHYREVQSDADVRRVEQVVDEVRGKHPSLRKKGGKKIFELQPNVEWDKGRAVLWLIEALGLQDSGVAVIYIGDDVTDEDAFQALRYRGIAIGIRVASPTAGTHAAYYLRDCDEVKEFLEHLVRLISPPSPATQSWTHGP